MSLTFSVVASSCGDVLYEWLMCPNFLYLILCGRFPRTVEIYGYSHLRGTFAAGQMLKGCAGHLYGVSSYEGAMAEGGGG